MDFQIEWLDHPKRCNYPLKRVGDRGSGKWERITWDQACKEIGEKMRYLADEYGPETVIFSHGTGRTDEWYEGRFFNLYGSPNLAMGGSEICWCPTYTNESATYGQFAAAFTAAKTGCVVLWGHNPAQSGDFPEHWGYQDLFANDPNVKHHRRRPALHRVFPQRRRVAAPAPRHRRRHGHGLDERHHQRGPVRPRVR